MESRSVQPEKKIPEIDPVLRQEVDSIQYTKTEQMREYYAFYHEIIWYGVEAVFHVQFAREALEVAARKKGFDDFITSYDIHKIDSRDSKFKASMQPLEDAGIYIPPQRESREVKLFSDDYMNLCGFPLSSFRLPKAALEETLRRQWSIEDFKDEALMKKALRVAKNLWAATAVNFDLNKGKTDTHGALPENVAQAAKKLMEYYWQIVDQKDGYESNPGQWLVYRRLKNPELKHDHKPQVFIGKRAELNEAAAQYPDGLFKCDRNPEILKVLRKSTRRKLAEALIEQNILIPEE